MTMFQVKVRPSLSPRRVRVMQQSLRAKLRPPLLGLRHCKRLHSTANRENRGNSALYTLRAPPMCSILSVRIELIANTRSLMKNQNADFGGALALTALLV